MKVATKQTTKPELEQQTPTPVDDAPDTGAPVFEKPELIESAYLFGCSPEIMAGALVMENKEAYTKQEAEAAVAAFLVRPVGKE